ncbi:hypothetical protein AGRA3207_000170 [Actinomadura graeca]|uniref:Uncharacterized protein n=1 Tax=Actinomadura graeca TaxID=2750812 RepID=A0ABX8QM41_9ACTN|nr:hypothetical protein [Actinomadura graeca]QXJ19608.1 hypothetical protein AGRA3207_000170 [Actinomadura graeca]
MSWVDADTITAAVNADNPAEETGITLADKRFPMPARLPLAFPYYLQQEDIAKALRCLFGDQLDDLIESAGNDLSVDWLRALVEQVYGDGAGEASASSRG